MQHSPATHPSSTAVQALLSVTSVVGVVVLVLTLLAVGVYAVVFFDLIPQMR